MLFFLFVDFSHVERREKTESIKEEMDFAEEKQKQKSLLKATKPNREARTREKRITVVYFDCKCLFTEAVKAQGR